MKSSLRKVLVLSFVFFLILSASAQRIYKMVEVVDRLRYDWDKTAIALKDYQGIQNFCADVENQQATLELLDEIHHWDTTLYFVVKAKFADSKNREAAATLRDIETLETDYTTLKFKEFILSECNEIKSIRENFRDMTVKEYEKDIRKFEKELVNYLTIITSRIDVVDEHMHHLELD